MYEYCAPRVAYIFCGREGRKKRRGKGTFFSFGREDGDEAARFLSSLALFNERYENERSIVERIIRKPTIRTARR